MEKKIKYGKTWNNKYQCIRNLFYRCESCDTVIMILKYICCTEENDVEHWLKDETGYVQTLRCEMNNCVQRA